MPRYQIMLRYIPEAALSDHGSDHGSDQRHRPGFKTDSHRTRPHNTMIQNMIPRPAALLTATFTLMLAAVPAAADEELMLLERGHEGWRYWDKGERPSETWNTIDFDVSEWKTGAAPLGYGVDGIATKISFGEDEKSKPAAAFFRLAFEVDDPDAHPVWVGELRCDNGAAVYLNGKEIYRYNMPEDDLDKATFAAGTLSSDRESEYHAFSVDSGHLRAGRNVLAVSVHQANAGSSDLVMDFSLKGGAEANKILAGHSMHGEIFNEGARQKAYLMEGCGDIDFPANTENELVQKFINQGLGQIYGFWFYESERSFRQAAALDPDCAIAYWGIAYANVPVPGFYSGNEKRAKGFIKEAMERREKASKREQMYIDALNTYLNVDAKERKEGGATYVRALEKILYEYPDDVECRALMTLHMWMNRKQVKINHTAIDAVMQQVFDRSPMHPTHHYRIHLWDNERSQVAVDSAAKCGQSAPGIAHMWHMGGHIFSKLKRYNDAAWQQEASARVDHAHMMRDRVLPDQIHNFAHNNEWLVRNLSNVGRVRDAISLAANMIELPRHPKYNTLSKQGSTTYGRTRLFETLRRYEKWQELIDYCNSPYLEPTDKENEADKRLRYLGMAYFRLGDIENGNKLLAELTSRLAEQKAKRDAAVEKAKAEEREKQANTGNAEADEKDVEDNESEGAEKKEAKGQAPDLSSQLNGTWRMTKVLYGGRTMEPPVDMLLTFDDGAMFQEASGQKKESKYRLDTKHPGYLDMIHEERTFKMLYKIDGNQLTTSLLPPGDERPSDFSTDNGFSIQVLERVEDGGNQGPVTITDLLGEFRRTPSENDWHEGEISRHPSRPGLLLWTNEAGVTWTLSPNLDEMRLEKESGSPYQDDAHGNAFQIVVSPAGRVTGFRFLNEVYEKETDEVAHAAGKPFDKRIRDLNRMIAGLEGHHEWAEGNFEKAYELLKKAGGEDSCQMARLQFLAGKQDEAIAAVTKDADRRKNEVQPLSCLVELLWKAGKKDEAKERFDTLRTVAGNADLGASPVFDRLTEAAEEFGYPSDWRTPEPLAEDSGNRVPLSSLGPFRWSPSEAPVWTLADADGNSRSMKEYQGKPVVVIFYLGLGCLHCVEQLQAFAPEYEAFQKAGLDVIAISSDEEGGLAESVKNFGKEKLPIPLFSDPSLEVFKRYRCFDDFENTPLHGTFVISPDGKILWQDISYEPFMDPKFVLNEGKRLLEQHNARFDHTSPAELLPASE